MLTPNLRLLRLLGRGGMGSVWLAEHLGLGCPVAVKLLSTNLANEPEALERFRREATAVAQLKSPHVVAIHDFGEAEISSSVRAPPDRVPFYVMEQLVGEDLGQRLERVKRLPIGIACAILVQTCKALSRVHELGIVHRDLKPGNIFLTQQDGDLVVKLLDFGVAKTRSLALGEHAKHETSDQQVLGTPLYMSPEQILSPRSVAATSDLYSLAVVIYECLAGNPPFDGETVGALHVAIASGRYTPICGVDKTLAPALDGWFARALALEPGDRFQSAREMSDAFLSALRGRPSYEAHALSSTAFTPSGIVRPPPPMQQQQRHAAAPTSQPSALVPLLAGILVVLVLIGGILAMTRGNAAATKPSAAAKPEASTITTITSVEVVAPPPSTPSTPSSTSTPSTPSPTSDEEGDVISATPPPVRPITPSLQRPTSPAVSPAKVNGGGNTTTPTRRKNRGF